jgi:4-amino-4-deoxy-L-arabinose transferase-like glycosyltransferase
MRRKSDQRDSTQPSQARLLPLGFWGLLALSAAVRLPGIGRPLLGNFATKNVVYGMIARNWAEGNASAWYPTLDCLVGGERSLHMVEFPVSAYLTGMAWWLAGGSLDVWGRLTAVACSTLSVALIFLLTRRWHGPAVAWGAALTMAFSPVSIIYGQSFMLEASVVTLTLAAMYSLERWLDEEGLGWLLLFALTLSLLLLSKIYMLVLLLPLAALAYRRGSDMEGRRRVRSAVVLVAAILLSILPAAVWYYDALRIGDADSGLSHRLFYSVRQSSEVHRWPHPLLFEGVFYRDLLVDLATVTLTPVGSALLLCGFLNPVWRRLLPWLAAMGVLVIALPLKFHEMNYYYLVVLPPLCVLVGLGWERVQTRAGLRKLPTAALLLLGLALSLRYSVKPAFVTPREDRGVVAAGRGIQALAQPEEPVVTVHGSTIDLLYYCDRPGWALPPGTRSFERRLAEYRREGARYLAIANLDQLSKHPAADEALASLPVVQSGQDFRIYRLADAGEKPATLSPETDGR